jgi:hypothetical protein
MRLAGSALLALDGIVSRGVLLLPSSSSDPFCSPSYVPGSWVISAVVAKDAACLCSGSGGSKWCARSVCRMPGSDLTLAARPGGTHYVNIRISPSHQGPDRAALRRNGANASLRTDGIEPDPNAKNRWLGNLGSAYRPNQP